MKLNRASLADKAGWAAAHFDVGDREVVQLIAGDAEILLPTEDAWRKVAAPEAFEIIANCKYQIRTTGVAEYLCDYYKD